MKIENTTAKHDGQLALFKTKFVDQHDQFLLEFITPLAFSSYSAPSPYAFFFYFCFLYPHQDSNHLAFECLSLTSLFSTLHYEVQLRITPPKIFFVLWLRLVRIPKITLYIHVFNTCCTLYENMRRICGSLGQIGGPGTRLIATSWRKETKYTAILHGTELEKDIQEKNIRSGTIHTYIRSRWAIIFISLRFLVVTKRSAASGEENAGRECRKSLLTSHSVMEMCCSRFMKTKYKCLRCELPTCNRCSVFEENEE